MQYILIIAVMIGSGIVGKTLAGRYVTRDLFFKELGNFLCYVKNNIGFRQTKILEIFEDYKKLKTTKFKDELNVVIDIVKYKKIEKSVGAFVLLKKEELDLIYKIFLDLGDFPVDIECLKLNEAIVAINEKSLLVEEARRKNESLTYKLSLFVGLLIGIIII